MSTGPTKPTSYAPPTRDRSRRALETTIVVVGFMVFTYVLFRSVFADMTGSVISTRGGRPSADIHLVLWVLSWGHHALSSAPLDLFQANIFHPAPSMLAGAEHMLGYLPLFSPAYAATGNPVFGLQVTLWLAFALSGAAMYALLRHWGCSVAAAVFGGLVITASPGKFDRAAMIQLVGWHYLPLVIIFIDRTLDRGKIVDAILLATLLTLHLLCSFYIAYASLPIVASYLTATLIGRYFASDQRLDRTRILKVFTAVAFAGVVLGAVAVPYMSRAASGEIGDYSGQGALALTRAGELYNYLPFFKSLSPIQFAGKPFNLGMLPLACLVIALLPASLTRSSVPAAARYGMFAGAVLCWLLAMGPPATFSGIHFPPLYSWFSDLVPGFSSMRVPFRFALGVCFCAAALAGVGFSCVLERLALPRWASATALCAAVAVTMWDFGVLQRPHGAAKIATGEEVPAVYRRLAEIEPGPVLELPIGTMGIQRIRQESEYTYFSTYHWNPILNGYTGYRPPSLDWVAALAQQLPNPRAAWVLQRTTGLRYVIVHEDKLSWFDARRWRKATNFVLIGRFGSDLLYRMHRELDADLIQRFLAPGDLEETLLGTELSVIPQEERLTDLQFWGRPPIGAIPGLPLMIPLSLTNVSSRRWPALAPGSSRALRWAARWENQATGIVHENLNIAPLAYDLAPRQTLQTTISLRPPRHFGDYRLSIGLVQAGTWFGPPLVADPVVVRGFPAKRSKPAAPAS